MKKKRIREIVIFLFQCLLIFSSCANTDGTGVSKTLKLLTGEEYEGRIYGSEGNQKTVEYISGWFEENGYSPLEGAEFAVPFQTELPILSETSLTISGNRDIVLEEGKDYIYSLMRPASLQGVIPEKDIGDGAEEQRLTIEAESGISLVLEQSENRVGNYMKITGMEPMEELILGLSEEAMGVVAENAGSTIMFESKGEMETLTLQNVIGVLPGKDRERAVVVGAHFDHMGKVGDTLYPGAVDNASGVTVLMDVSRKLAGKTPDVDIVFTFWNAEEVGMQGSKAGAQQLEGRYDDFCYINLDCVGMKEAGDILATTANHSDSMCQMVGELLGTAGYDVAVEPEESMNSDHVSFDNQGSVNLGQSMGSIGKVIHYPADTMEKVDEEELKRFSAAMAKMLEQSSAELLASARQSNFKPEEDIGLTLPEENYAELSPREQHEYIKKIENQLAYDEYFIMPQAGYLILGREGVYFDSLAKVQELYSGIDAAVSIGDYQLVQIYINSSLITADGEPEKVGKVMKRLFATEHIDFISLYYENNGKCLDYTEYYTSDAKDQVRAYGETGEIKELPERGMAWIAYEEGYSPQRYIAQKDGKAVFVFQGPVNMDDDGVYKHFITDDPDYTESTLLSLVDMLESAYPVISIK